MFTQICKMPQKSLKKYVAKKLNETHKKIINADGFVYAQGTFPVLLVAHLDTVHKELPTQFFYDEIQGALSSPQGIGGDDRCGVYMIFKVLEKYNCSVLFCEDEEIGCVGAEKFIKSNTAKNLEFNYIIEFDRKGSNDAVFYECANNKFEEFITKEFYKTAYGSFSDISVIAPFLKCAAVNLSCGYYNAHTTDEYVVIADMEDSIEWACKILARTTEEDKFEYIEDEYRYGFDYLYDDKFSQDYVIEWYDEANFGYKQVEISADSKAEAVGLFLMGHPSLTYDDIYVFQDADADYVQQDDYKWHL